MASFGRCFSAQGGISSGPAALYGPNLMIAWVMSDSVIQGGEAISRCLSIG